MAANIGEAGGLDALKVGAEVAQTAIVLLDDTLITVGKTLGVLAGAVATLDFSGVEEAFADIEKESRDKLLKAAQHNDTLRGYIKSMGNEALSAAVAQQELAKSTQQAGQAAAAQGSTWVKLATDYGKVLEAVREQIAQAEKSVIARDAEGKASVALAAAFGTETQQREAQAKGKAAVFDHAFIAEHTTGFADLRKQLAELTPGAVAPICGIKADDIVDRKSVV